MPQASASSSTASRLSWFGQEMYHFTPLTSQILPYTCMKPLRILSSPTRYYPSYVTQKPLNSLSKKSFVMTTPLLKVSSPRRFAPLKEGSGKVSEGLPRLKGIVFDVDGTLWFVFWFYMFSDCSFILMKCFMSTSWVWTSIFHVNEGSRASHSGIPSVCPFETWDSGLRELSLLSPPLTSCHIAEGGTVRRTDWTTPPQTYLNYWNDFSNFNAGGGISGCLKWLQ
jgi:hypothetical protein